MSGAEGFAALPNWMIRDSSIGLHALMVYLALASHAGPGGIHPSQPTIAAEARCSESSVRRALVELEALGVVERVRRKDSRGRASNGYVLHPNGRLGVDEEAVSVAVSVTDTGVVPVSSDGGSGQGAQVVPYTEEEPIKKKRAVARGTRMEQGWKPDAGLLAWAREHAQSVSAERESESFVDYWLAVPGSRGVKQDWPATWRNWMRRAHERNVERGWRPAEAALVGVEEWMLR